MLVLGSSGNFLVAPSTGLLLYTIILIVFVLCGLVTAAKGRWGWLLLGFLTVGIFWVVGALQSPRPGSVWLRISAARHAHG